MDQTDTPVTEPSAPSDGEAEGIHVEYVSCDSPDGVYRAENYGENTSVTAAGLYPAEGIRIVNIDGGEIVWDRTPGYYTCAFLWSPDSRYLAISYMARTEGYALVVDTEDFTETEIPVPESVAGNMRSFRPDPCFTAGEWTDGLLRVSYTYTGADELLYSGAFLFDPASGEISGFSQDEGTSVG